MWCKQVSIPKNNFVRKKKDGCEGDDHTTL